MHRAVTAAGVMILTGTLAGSASAEQRVERNVVYGMHSGLALLMDVYYPETPNGSGIIFIWGSGWHAPLSAAASQLKARGSFPALVDAGYTVFVVNHRAAPRFRYPAAVEDAQRAVRFVRHDARRFGVDADRLGGTGASSGAHLVSMLGTLDGQGDPDDSDPVNHHSSKLQAVVVFAGPSDLAVLPLDAVVNAVTTSFIGMAPISEPGSEEYRTYRQASPINHVTRDDPPFLLLHGDEDDVIPFEQAGFLSDALLAVGVRAEVLRVRGGDHGLGGAQNPPDWKGAMVDWFDQHLVDQE